MFDKELWQRIVNSNLTNNYFVAPRACGKTYKIAAINTAYTASLIAYGKGFIKTIEEAEEYFNEIYKTTLNELFKEC